MLEEEVVAEEKSSVMLVEARVTRATVIAFL
jgi:hypothetical protein